MNAHIITIGDEILIGQTLNTNAALIGEKLTAIQLKLKSSSVVGDVESQILDEFERCFKIYDVVLVTGGLGPTHDDVTRQCIVKFFNTTLIKNKDVLANIKSLFARKGREITKVNENQALVPEIAKIISNQYGTAPGLWIEKDNKIFIVMPGVPYEMKAMMDDFVISELQSRVGQLSSIIKMKTLQTTGIPESSLYEKLGDITELLNGAKLALLPSQFGVKLRITVDEKNEEAAKNKISEVEQKIRAKAGRYIFTTEDEPLENVIARLLKERQMTISVAESCTGGNIANALTNINGSSSYFERGVVAYSNAAKVEILKVNEDTIAQYGAVSLEVARQMAAGVKAISGTDLGISITGILGPTGATAGKPVGLVYIGLCDDKVCTAKKFLFGGDRLLNKQRATQAALEMIRRHLLGITFDD
ncbi:MAG: competence/damage-inducible protein A [Ignavibacteriaceae bacterium]|nr:competence/damage-inducible protein A [Ignavibacteriaceae bacterium]